MRPTHQYVNDADILPTSASLLMSVSLTYVEVGMTDSCLVRSAAITRSEGRARAIPGIGIVA